MKWKNYVLLAPLVIGSFLIVGCGDDNQSQKLSDADIVYIKQKRLQEMYGANSTTTTTSTEVKYVTVTNTTVISR